jgi:hypothetical protein
MQNIFPFLPLSTYIIVYRRVGKNSGKDLFWGSKIFHIRTFCSGKEESKKTLFAPTLIQTTVCFIYSTHVAAVHRRGDLMRMTAADLLGEGFTVWRPFLDVSTLVTDLMDKSTPAVGPGTTSVCWTEQGETHDRRFLWRGKSTISCQISGDALF